MNLNMKETANPLTDGRIIKENCPISEYLASKGDNIEVILSRSDLCQILACPSKWRKGARPQDRATWQTDFGSLVDCLLTQPERFSEYYKVPPKTYQTAAKGETKEWTWHSPTCRDWRDEQKADGFNVCTDEDLADARQAVDSLLQDPKLKAQLNRLVSNSRKQVFSMAQYVDPETEVKVWLKCLTDIVPDKLDPEFGKCLFDLKTARSAAPRAWRKAAFDDDLHTQAAINLDVYSVASGEDRCDFRHLIIENELPHEPARRFLTTEFIQLGREKYVRALKLYCQCAATNDWPTYKDPNELTLDDGFEGVSPEPWMYL